VIDVVGEGVETGVFAEVPVPEIVAVGEGVIDGELPGERLAVDGGVGVTDADTVVVCVKAARYP
jgi:hypothetical protein